MPDCDIVKEFLERFPLPDTDKDSSPLIIEGHYYSCSPLQLAMMAAILELDQKNED